MCSIMIVKAIAVEGSGDQFVEQDRLQFGARFIFGDPNQYLGSFEAAYADIDQEGGEDGSEFRYAGAIDYRIDENLWFTATVGQVQTWKMIMAMIFSGWDESAGSSSRARRL